MAELTTASLRHGFGRIAERIEQCADELNELDAALGDGDLGITLQRGGRAVSEVLADLPDDVGMALMQCAQAFTKQSGSSFGTLLATGLLAAAKQTRGRTAVPWSELPALLAAAQEAMMARGKAQLGEKTVLDALAAAHGALADLDDPAGMQAAADRAVGEALDTFRDRPAKQGRARMFGERSVGQPDPGMVAFKRMVEALA